MLVLRAKNVWGIRGVARGEETFFLYELKYIVYTLRVSLVIS